MTEKILTAIYLTMMVGVFLAVCRRPLTIPKDEASIRRAVMVMCGAYLMMLCFLFVKIYHTGNIPCLALLLLFCPFVWAVLNACRITKYEGPLNLLLLALMLTSIGIVMQYRLNKPVAGLLTRIVGIEKVPCAVNHFFFSAVSISAVSLLLLFSGRLSGALKWAEERTSFLFWGCLSFGLLCLPFVLGSSIGGTRSWILSGSVQPSELVLKITFVAFMAAFLSRKTHILSLKACPLGETIKIIASLVVITGIFFVFPMAGLERELGTTLLLGIAFVVMVSLTTGRLSFLPLGVGLIAGAIALACLIHPRTATRIVGGWWEWREYAFKPYYYGSKLWPGLQPFLARAAYEGANIWGKGIGAGRPGVIPEVSSDFIGVAVIEGMGVMGLLLIIAVFIVFMKGAFLCRLRPDFRGCLLVGIAVVLFTQAFYNLGGILGVIPLTGVPLSFISTGGTSILAGYLMIGLMMCLEPREEREIG